MPKKTSEVKKKIYIIEDHQVLRQGLRLFIEQEPDMAVCGEAGNAADALAAISQAQPDAVVSDISMPGMNGIEFLKNMKARHPQIAAVILSMHDESIYAERALRAGAFGYVMKKESAGEVITALRKALKGEYHVSKLVVGAVMHKVLRAQEPEKSAGEPIELLSDRELEVFERIGQGKSTINIAEALHVSPKTIETHRVHIKEKLQINSISELTQYAALWVEQQMEK